LHEKYKNPASADNIAKKAQKRAFSLQYFAGKEFNI